MRYAGPLRNEPLPVELHNTIYAAGEKPMDGLADAQGVRAWLAGLGERLPAQAGVFERGRIPDLLALRSSVREALSAVAAGDRVPKHVVHELNRVSAANPGSLQLVRGGAAQVRHHGATPADVILGVIAASTIELVTGPDADHLHACGAPGCVLMFLKDHPRREWCSAACGNRARQARHYARTRGRG